MGGSRFNTERTESALAAPGGPGRASVVDGSRGRDHASRSIFMSAHVSERLCLECWRAQRTRPAGKALHSIEEPRWCACGRRGVSGFLVASILVTGTRRGRARLGLAGGGSPDERPERAA